MKTATLILLLAVSAFAGTKHYETGTVERRVVDAGYVDTTHCYNDAHGDAHCAGGISDAYAPVYTLVFADGSRHHIEHVSMTRDTLKALDFSRGPVSVQYRIDHKWGFGGVDYAEIQDGAGKEGAYSFDTLRVTK